MSLFLRGSRVCVGRYPSHWDFHNTWCAVSRKLFEHVKRSNFSKFKFKLSLQSVVDALGQVIKTVRLWHDLLRILSWLCSTAIFSNLTSTMLRSVAGFKLVYRAVCLSMPRGICMALIYTNPKSGQIKIYRRWAFFLYSYYPRRAATWCSLRLCM